MKIRRKIPALSITASVAISLVAVVGMPGLAAAAGIFTQQTNQAARHSFSLKYVALGDSLASGLGLAPVPDAGAEDNLCGRSSEAYSSIVAASVSEKLKRLHIGLDASSAACQGATTDNLLQAQSFGETSVRPQLDAAFDGRAPTLLTITMGANDIHWAQFIGACFATTTCNTDENTAAVRQYIDTAKGNLMNTLEEVRSRSGFIPPMVVVTGYYTPVSAQCAGGGMTVEEAAWIKDQTNALNNALNDATQQPGTGWFTRFAPIDFTGHDICSGDSWIQRPGTVDGMAPFHPTVRGQQVIADAVMAKLGL